MSATFGRLQGPTLELKPGLNIVQAPNEAGKSTWCAFLTAMFYGINSRERDKAGFIAEKNRYAPWSGASMSGRLDCRSGSDELTLTRTTRRQTAPLAEFQACYAGTGDPVPGLTGQTCGETLLGVSREVFERSAFIRQSGLAITQDAGLERRIASLISSGEEDTSYTEAREALKKQLTRRRYNTSGMIPGIEAELQDTQRQLSELQALEAQLAAARQRVETLSARAHILQDELAACDAWEQQSQAQALANAKAAAEAAEQKLSLLRQRLEADRVPEVDTIGRLRGAIVNLETVRKNLEKARSERDEAMKAALRAEAAVAESPFAGQTAEQVRRETSQPPEPVNWKKWPGLAVIVLGTLLSFLLFYAAGVVLTGSSWQKPASVGALLAGLCITYLLAGQLRRHAMQDARNAALIKRYGTTDADAIAALADTYYKLCAAQEAAQADVSAKTATADALYASLSSNEQGILLEVRRFAPSAFDISAADEALKGAFARRRELSSAEAAARETRLRYEVLAQQSPVLSEAPISLSAPARGREAVEQELGTLRGELAAARSAADQLSGQLSAQGDSVVLCSQAALLTEQKAALNTEYDAIALAMETLEHANTTLQNRFSPALGRRAAEIFARLTDGRYSGVVLDRTFHLSAEPADERVYRDAALLSAGASDQLYLAVRLAICDLVLPQETCVPIVLDDALTNFDDDRCAAALRYLKEAAQTRQILLFTCHSREADFFAGDLDVSVVHLAAQ